MKNVVVFPSRVRPAESEHVAATNAQQEERASDPGELSATAPNVVDTDRQLRAGLTGLVQLLDAALQEINPLLQAIKDPSEREALGKRIQVARVDVEIAKFRIGRMADKALQ